MSSLEAVKGPITFTITFHGPFHVGSVVASQGIARVLDRQVLLPATSLKGLMRATATETLGIPEKVTDAVFGTPGSDRPKDAPRRTASPWSWSDAVVSNAQFTRGARIAVGANGVAEAGFLMIGESAWANTAAFTVTPLGRLGSEDLKRHQLVLRAAARAVTSMGGGRTRGEGWVSIADGTEWTASDTSNLLGLGAGR